MAKVAVNPETGCWEWTACRVKNGYGRFGPTPGLVVYAHRYSWETFVGPIPPGLEVLHHCDNPRCVFADPDPLVSHLFLGDAQINNEDMWNKGRARPQPAVEPCGTYAAYRRHQRAGEVPCGPCREAFLEWMREYHRRTGT